MMDTGRGENGWSVGFSGGGTGGHLYPALALAEALGDLRPDTRPFFVGAERGLEARVLPERGLDHVLVPVEGIRRGSVWGNLRPLVRLAQALVRVAGVFRIRRPRLVVVTGGYAGGPAGIMAALMRIRLVLQEQNAVPGITTRVLSLFAREIHLAFPEATEHLPRLARGRARISGNPVRPPREIWRQEAAAAFGLDPSRPVALVVGGSQGSAALNQAVLEVVTGVMDGTLGARRPQGAGTPRPSPDVQLLWSTGPAHLSRIRDELESLGSPDWVRAVGYIEEMPLALGLAALAVSRAGAMATSEFLAWGVPAVLIPLPSAAADHQRRNAEALAEAGAAFMVEEEGLEGRVLWAWIARIVGDPRTRESMARAARERGRPTAAREIALALDAHLPRPASRVEEGP